MEQADILRIILDWVIPLGGLGSLVAWFSNRTKRQIERVKETHDAYKIMYEDLNGTLKEELDEKKKMRTLLSKLERAINKIPGCRLYPNCPVHIELLSDKANHSERKGAKGQRRNKGNTESDPGNDTPVHGSADDTDEQPP